MLWFRLGQPPVHARQAQAGWGLDVSFFGIVGVESS